MVKPSSTSSSERSWPSARWPIATLGAIFIVVVAESVLHFVPSRDLYGYGRGINSYFEVHNHVDDHGSAQIAIVGSSRGRESFALPTLHRTCNDSLDRAVTVANYSVAGARADIVRQIVRHLLDSRSRPELIVYTVSPRLLIGGGPFTRGIAIFTDRPDTLTPLDGQPLRELTSDISFAARQLLNDHLLLFRHRHRFRQAAVDLARGRSYPSPVLGELTEWQTYEPNKTLHDWNIDENYIRRRVEDLHERQGRFRFNEYQVREFTATIDACVRFDVPLVIVEAPLPQVLLRHYPADVRHSLHMILEAAARHPGVDVVVPDSLGLTFSASEFREISHLNYHGARKLTEQLAPILCARLTRGAG